MTIQQRTTLTQFLIEERRRFPSASGDFNALILDVALACKAIAKAVAFGELGGMYGNHAADEGDSINVQGETQKKLDINRYYVYTMRYDKPDEEFYFNIWLSKSKIKIPYCVREEFIDFFKEAEY